MALIHTGSVVTDIRGSAGTETYARNRGGIYVRERKGPAVNVGDNRIACRDAMRILSQYWSGTLTEQQRSDWRMYAHQHPGLDRWGQPRITTGYCAFIRHNWYYRHFLSSTQYSKAPTSPPVHQPICTISADSVSNTVNITVPPSNYDPPPYYLYLWAYIGYEQNPGVNFAPNKWRNWSWNEGSPGFWMHDPWTAAYPETLHSGQKLWMKLFAQQDPTGQLSTAYITSCIVNPYDGDPHHDPDWRARAIARLEELIANCPADKPRRLQGLQQGLQQRQEH